MAWTDNFKRYDTSQGYGNKRKWQKAFNQMLDPEAAAEILSHQEMTPYELLEVSKFASRDDIKKAYFTQMKKWHPDANPNLKPEDVIKYTERCKSINAAYSILMQ